MSRPVTAGLRYAEAAFQVALAEDQLDRWQADLFTAAEILGRDEEHALMQRVNTLFQQLR